MSLKHYTHFKPTPSGFIPQPQEAPPAPQLSTIPPGAYIVQPSQLGPHFVSLVAKKEPIFKLPCSATEVVVAEAEKFWGRRERYKKYGVPHKRGILLYGPPGAGKSTAIREISADIVKRGGIVVYMMDVDLFRSAVSALRQIQPACPVVMIMEDLEDLLDEWGESQIINMLDGFEEIDRILFLATTNKVDVLPKRVANRPSRFDRKIMIDYPSAELREAYLKHLDVFQDIIDMPAWILNTEGMSIAHLKELFTSVVILEGEFIQTVANLKAMDYKTLDNEDDD